jgi:hypothetical protein
MNFRDWCLHHFPGGRFSGDSYVCKNVFRGEKNESFSITEHNRKWHDFGTGEGGDIRFFCHEHGIEAWNGVEPWKESRERKDSPAPEANPNEPDARAMWECSVSVGTHPYLDKKGLSGEGLRITTKEWRHSDGKTTQKGTLLVPARDIDGVLHGVERILPDGKLHLGRKARCFFGDAPEPGKPFLLAEGYATACAIRRLSGWPAAEAFGFACLENSARAVTERYPGIEVVQCPDRINEETQRAVVNRLKEKWTVLELPDERPKNHDWDDELRERGVDVAKETFRERWSLARAKAPELPKKKNSLGLLYFDELTYTEPEFLVAGLIEKGTTGLLFGAMATKKSFIALDIAACVATGCAFHGRVVEQGPVVYLAGEGSKGIVRRLKAWEQHFGVSLKGAPLLVSMKAPAFGDPRETKEAVDDIREKLRERGIEGAALIVVDTVARAAVGLDENSNQDMSGFVGVLDDMKTEFGCVVMAVHHSGYMESGRARGASCVPAAMDFIFAAKADGSFVTLTATKTKDAEEPAPITFECASETIGAGRYGEPLTSLVLEEVDSSPRERSKPLTKTQQLGLDTFREAAKKAGTLDVHLEAWREAFYRTSTADNPSAKKVAFQRVRKDLVELGKLTVKDDVYSESGEFADLIRNENAKRNTEQSGTFAEHVPFGTLDEAEQTEHTPIRGVPCSVCVPSENDARAGKEECSVIALSDKEQGLLPRGSLEKIASTSGVPVDLIRESLKPLLESGRIVLSGNDIYENPTRPNVEDPSEAIEDDEADESDDENVALPKYDGVPYDFPECPFQAKGKSSGTDRVGAEWAEPREWSGWVRSVTMAADGITPILELCKTRDGPVFASADGDTCDVWDSGKWRCVSLLSEDPEPDEEDAAPPGPEKGEEGEEGPGDSSSRIEPKASDEETRKLERLFADATPDEGLPSRGFPLDAVPENPTLPCLVDDGSGHERWLTRIDVLSSGKRYFYTSRSRSGRNDWTLEEPVKGAAS